jgi:hypothetical protein
MKSPEFNEIPIAFSAESIGNTPEIVGRSPEATKEKEELLLKISELEKEISGLKLDVVEKNIKSNEALQVKLGRFLKILAALGIFTATNMALDGFSETGSGPIYNALKPWMENTTEVVRIIQTASLFIASAVSALLGVSKGSVAKTGETIS